LLRLSCPSCNNSFAVATQHVGATVRCPICGIKRRVLSPDDAPFVLAQPAPPGRETELLGDGERYRCKCRAGDALNSAVSPNSPGPSTPSSRSRTPRAHCGGCPWTMEPLCYARTRAWPTIPCCFHSAPAPRSFADAKPKAGLAVWATLVLHIISAIMRATPGQRNYPAVRAGTAELSCRQKKN
jgi:hypothetical protein